MNAYIGFDSAWTDNPRAPGAICAIIIKESGEIEFHPPILVSFSQALDFIKDKKSSTGITLVALDQPTVVPNATSMRPVERVAASLISWIGGGVQPANRGRVGMFCDASPLWRFLKSLSATEDPEKARVAKTGLYLIEVFPALALASLSDEFFSRNGSPKYNPGRRKTFRPADWIRVSNAASREAHSFDCEKLAEWCHEASKIPQPRKADQDKLDSALCVLIALRWRLRPRQDSILLGDLETGYMVLPASPSVREYLSAQARLRHVPLDGAE